MQRSNQNKDHQNDAHTGSRKLDPALVALSRLLAKQVAREYSPANINAESDKFGISNADKVIQ